MNGTCVDKDQFVRIWDENNTSGLSKDTDQRLATNKGLCSCFRALAEIENLASATLDLALSQRKCFPPSYLLQSVSHSRGILHQQHGVHPMGRSAKVTLH